MASSNVETGVDRLDVDLDQLAGVLRQVAAGRPPPARPDRPQDGPCQRRGAHRRPRGANIAAIPVGPAAEIGSISSPLKTATTPGGLSPPTCRPRRFRPRASDCAERCVQHAGKGHVVDVAPWPGKKPGVLAALDRRPYEPGGRSPPTVSVVARPVAGLHRPAARPRPSTMPW